jgi:hypothetical protein
MIAEVPATTISPEFASREKLETERSMSLASRVSIGDNSTPREGAYRSGEHRLA